jgi:hypothetical protein
MLGYWRQAHENTKKNKTYTLLPGEPSGYYLGELNIDRRIILDLTGLEYDTLGGSGSGFMVN